VRDPIVLGALAGLAGSVVRAFLTHLLFMIGVANASGLHVAQRDIMHVPEPLTGLNLVVSIIAFLVFGALPGVILALVYVFFGRDYGYVKGAGFGLTVYFLGVNFLLPIVQPDLDLPLSALTILGSYITHTLYGLVTAFVILRFGQFQERRIV